MEIFLMFIVFMFFMMLLFAEHILNFIFYIINKIDDFIHPIIDEKMTRMWETKNIVNHMWLDENLSQYFVQDEIDKLQDKINEINEIVNTSEIEANNSVDNIKKWEKETIGLPTGHIFDLVLYQIEQDNCVKYKSMLEISHTEINQSLITIQALLVKLTVYYGLLKHIKEEVKTKEFIENVTNAMENDISFVENNRNLNEMDVMGFSFVQNLLDNLNIEELNDKFKKRLIDLK